MYEQAGSIRWAPRIPPALIRRLYETEASGMPFHDELEDVGLRLFERCRDILIATDAMAGRAMCPRCESIVEHDGKSKTWLACTCGWKMRWSAYERSFRDRGMYGGRASPYFRAFVDAWPAARDRRSKMLLVDQVIHAIHMDSADAKHGRQAVSAVIEAPEVEARALLDELAGADVDDDRRAARERWRDVDSRTRRKPT